MKITIKIYTGLFLLITSIMGIIFCYGLIHKQDRNPVHNPLIQIGSVVMLSSLILLV